MSYIFPINPAPGDAAIGPNSTTWVWDGVKWVGGMGGPYLSLAGGDMTGPLFLFANPTLPFEAATKDYVDNVVLVSVPEAPMTGMAYGRELRTWTPVLPITGGLMQGGINMNGWLLTGLRVPLLPADAVTKDYVDHIVSLIRIYHGTWNVAANVPNLATVTGLTTGDYYIAITANPQVPEIAPPGIPGIAGMSISNGSEIVWNSDISAFEIIPGGGLTKAEADLFYVQLSGSTLTGPLVLAADPTTSLEAATKEYVDTEIADAIAALPGHGGGTVPEAPTDGQTYGRDGALAAWVPVVTTTSPISGGTF